MSRKSKRKMTLEEWLNEWYDLYAKPNVKQSTAVSYEGYIRNHVVPAIGNIPLSELNVNVLQKFFNDKRGTHSPKTVSNIRMMMHSAFKTALMNDLIPKNYVEFVQIAIVEKKEMRVFTRQEQQKLMVALKYTDEQYAFGIFLCLTTGIRVGELCGLQWENIDLNHGIFKIRKTVQRLEKLKDDGTGKKTEIVIGSPKSRASVRDIPLEPEIIKEILRHKEKMNKFFGESITAPKEFLITCKHDTPIEPRTMQDIFKRIINHAGIQKANFHALRHTFATRALEAGVDFKTLSVLLGHADVYTTMNRYAHVLEDQKRSAMKNILSVIIPDDESEI